MRQHDYPPESDVVVVCRVGCLVDLLDDGDLEERCRLMRSTALAAATAVTVLAERGVFLLPLAHENGVYTVG